MIKTFLLRQEKGHVNFPKITVIIINNNYCPKFIRKEEILKDRANDEIAENCGCIKNNNG
jgi:hypothetical protein